jgi:integrase
MANLRKRKLKGTNRYSYTARIRVKNYPEETKSFGSMAAAREWATITEAAMREGRYLKTSIGKDKTVSHLIEEYLTKVLSRNTKPRTKTVVQQELRFWQERIGSLKLAEVSPAIIAELRDELSSTRVPRGNIRKPATVNHYLNNLNHAFGIALREWGWITVNPVSQVQRMKKKNARTRFLTDDERLRLLRAADDVSNGYLRSIILFCVYTGARRGELEKLCWKHVDFKRKKVMFLDTKNGESRAVHISPQLKILLQGLGDGVCQDHHRVFGSPNDPTRPIQFNNAFKRARRIAKLEDFRFHDLRHEAATQLAKSGATLLEIAAVLGHKTLAMVKRYSHLTEDHTRDAIERMNQRISKEI